MRSLIKSTVCKFRTRNVLFANLVPGSILDDKLYLFKSEIWLESMTAQMIIGQIDLENSISIDDYSSRWWVVGNMTTGNVITGTSSRMYVCIPSSNNRTH